MAQAVEMPNFSGVQTPSCISHYMHFLNLFHLNLCEFIRFKWPFEVLLSASLDCMPLNGINSFFLSLIQFYFSSLNVPNVSLCIHKQFACISKKWTDACMHPLIYIYIYICIRICLYFHNLCILHFLLFSFKLKCMYLFVCLDSHLKLPA